MRKKAHAVMLKGLEGIKWGKINKRTNEIYDVLSLIYHELSLPLDLIPAAESWQLGRPPIDGEAYLVHTDKGHIHTIFWGYEEDCFLISNASGHPFQPFKPDISHWAKLSYPND